jgi:hypothetical protein
VLERLQVAVRLRGNWEALDLGGCLLRRYGSAVYAVWLPLVGPFALLLALLLHRWPWAAALGFWWFKPLYDRLVLHVLGRAAFGETATLRQTLRAVPAIFRHGTLASLLWRRWSPQRSYLLPLWQLEQQSGPAFRRRVKPVLRRGRFTAQVLTLSCLHFEWIVQLGVLAALQLFVPRGSDFNVFQYLFAGEGAATPPWFEWLLALLPFVAATLVEPYYIAAGFGLYLNRRVQLEAWDLELAFRKLAKRLLRVAAVTLVLATAIPVLGQELSAQGRIEQVLKAREFQTSRMEKGLHWKNRKPDKREDTPRSPWLDALSKVLATLLKWSFILAGGLMVGWFLWRSRGLFGFGRREDTVLQAPATLFGLEVRPESLPPNVEGAVRALLQEGRFRAALALLYRASLSRLVSAHGLEVFQGATEGDCLRLAEKALPAGSLDYFRELTRAWQDAAYAQRPPADGEGLCRRYTTAFGEPK